MSVLYAIEFEKNQQPKIHFSILTAPILIKTFHLHMINFDLTL